MTAILRLQTTLFHRWYGTVLHQVVELGLQEVNIARALVISGVDVNKPNKCVRL